MKVIVVDDEKLALNRIVRLLNENGINDIDSFSDSLKAKDSINKNNYDLAFLDISMPNISGLDLSSYLLEKNFNTFVVFQTAYEEYALKAFDKGGLAYLLKPIENEKLQLVLKKASNYLQENNTDKKLKKIIGKSGENIFLVEVDDIYFIKADLEEVIIQTKDSEIYVKRKISDFEEYLKGKNFFRIHRSYIVNVEKIKSMQSVEQSKLQISFNGIDNIITSSKEGAKVFREYLEKISF